MGLNKQPQTVKLRSSILLHTLADLDHELINQENLCEALQKRVDILEDEKSELVQSGLQRNEEERCVMFALFSSQPPSLEAIGPIAAVVINKLRGMTNLSEIHEYLNMIVGEENITPSLVGQTLHNKEGDSRLVVAMLDDRYIYPIITVNPETGQPTSYTIKGQFNAELGSSDYDLDMNGIGDSPSAMVDARDDAPETRRG